MNDVIFAVRRLVCGLASVVVWALSSLTGPALAQDVAELAPSVVESVALERAAAALEPALSPEAEALRDALLAGGDTLAPIYAFYESNGFEPVWSAARQNALLSSLRNAGQHGLPAERYQAGALEQRLLASSPQVAEIEAGKAFLAYARDVSSGILEPRKIDRDIVIRPPRPEAAALLSGLAEAADPMAFFDGLAPQDKQYKRLLEEKHRLRALIVEGGWGEAVPAGRTLKPGQSAARVTAMRARLARMDGVDYGEDPLFDDALVEAVKAFQTRHGLNADGVAGPRTLAAINASVEDRLAQVFVNLERQRWLSQTRGERHIFVNQADFSVAVIENGEEIFWSRTVIGKNKHRTQEFNDVMTHLVINPTWHVPRSIATEEMLPKLRRNPGALGGSFDVMTRNGTRVNPRFVNFAQFNEQNFPFIIKQRPSGGNALGRVKFMFPNQFNIYLHDTPAKSLFNRDARAYSHGCVRVQRPFELAYTLLGPQSENPEGLFKSLLNSGRERRLNLEKPVPIYLTYHSAWVDDAGQPQYREDIYGRDKAVFRALEREGIVLVPVEG